jgi:hypothetical protein
MPTLCSYRAAPEIEEDKEAAPDMEEDWAVVGMEDGPCGGWRGRRCVRWWPTEINHGGQRERSRKR